MFDERLKELRSQVGRATDAEQKHLITADIVRLERAMELDAELRESPNPAGGGRVRTAQRPNETETEFRARAEKELARVELV
jgi:hypothetical protein